MDRTHFISGKWARGQKFAGAAIACLSLLWLALAATAQSIQPIYSFTNAPANPAAGLTLGLDGNFYGTTYLGGSANDGTVFRITTNGTLTVMASFASTNGANPQAGLTLGADGNFYGTTYHGGSGGYGTVFQITSNGTLTTLMNFGYTNGANPDAALALGPDGSFYGTTSSGGSGTNGTVFRLTGNGAFTTLASFTVTNGAHPEAALTLGADGNFYGTTYSGGSGGYGTVFRIATNGTLTTLVSFAKTNGANPAAGLTLGPDGNFYGTTYSGGGSGNGIVFRITTNGLLTVLASVLENPSAALVLGPDGSFYGTAENGGYGSVFRVTTNGTLTVLASFDGANGANPECALALGPEGNFYGTTYNGGSGFSGTVFQITTNGTLITLASLANTNGENPQAALALGADGNFYATTKYGGLYGGNNSGPPGGYGTVFEIPTNGAFATLLSFNYTNGAFPQGRLTRGPGGNFYGTTENGGSIRDGTVFQITTNGALTTLATFANTNGSNPQAGLTLGPDGNFYGMTVEGGSSGYGTVFQITTNGALTTLVSFNSANGAYPQGELTLGPDGNFYGTTPIGGSSNAGTVFQITASGTLTTLYSFSSATVFDPYSQSYTNADGQNPEAGLTLGPDGNFYGTTSDGGTGGNGTVFQITTNGTLTTLHSFSAVIYDGAYLTNGDGAYPEAALTPGPDGDFYGTTSAGGTGGNGAVFRITTNGTLTLLASFAVTNGSNPRAELTLGPDGNFYGTTYGGGGGDDGSIYRLDLPPSIIAQPSNQIVAAGGSAPFTVALFGTAPFAYQWLYNSTLIAGGTNSTLDISNVTPSSAGNYQVIVTNIWGSVTSSIATLSVAVSPTITNQPASQSLPIGGTAVFAVGATGTPPLAYQWYFNTNTPLTSATNATLSFGPVLTNEAGNYQVLVTSPYGSVTSDLASLAVLLQPNCYGISNSGSRTVTLLLASTPGSTNRVWATTNLNLPLAQWQPIATNTADATGLFQFSDTNAGTGAAKFYILSSP